MISKPFSIHRNVRPVALLLALLLSAQPIAMMPETRAAARAITSDAKTIETATKTNVEENYGKLPLSFEANRGQAPAAVKFVARGAGYSFFLTPEQAVLRMRNAECDQSATLKMEFVGGNRQSRISGLDPLPGKTSYFLGSDPKQWRTDVPTFSQVKYGTVYPGVDVVFYGNQQQLEYDFLIAPGTDPRQIKLRFAGMRAMRLEETGDLVLTTDVGEVRQHKPVVYQIINNQRRQISASYRLLRASHSATRNQVSFTLGDYDPCLPLVIDPVLSYSTFLGATSSAGAGHGEAIAVDALGNAYITGYVGGEFPTTAGALKMTNPAPSATFAFVVKLDPTGSRAIYSALIGGTNGFYVPNGPDANATLYLENRAYGIAVDAQGNAYVTGETMSSNFPTTPNAVQRVIAPGTDDRHPPNDAFVVKLNADGSALSYATLLGGIGGDRSFAIAVNAAGEAWVAGVSAGRNFPTTSGAFQSNSQSGGVAFISKLNALGETLLYSTYFGGPPRNEVILAGGSGSTAATGLALDAQGSAYVTGLGTGVELPSTPGAYRAAGGGVFVAKFSGDGTLAYAATLGANAVSSFPAARNKISVAVDGNGSAYVAGSCEWDKFPTTSGAFQSTGGSPNPNIVNIDGYVAKLNPNATALAYATYFGAIDDHDLVTGLAVDGEGCAYLTGYSFSQRFPVTTGSQRAAGAGNGAFVTKLNAAGGRLVYSTMLGVGNDSNAQAIAVDRAGNAYVTGGAQYGYQTTPGSYQPYYEGLPVLPPGSGKSYDHAFASKVAAVVNPEPLAVSPLPAPTPIPRPTSHTIWGFITEGNNALPGGVITWNGATSGSVTADNRGRYLFELSAGGAYVITPVLAGRTFIPASVTVNNLSETQMVNFALIALPGARFQITGIITDDKNQPLGNARVNLSGTRSGNTTTNSQGLYQFQDLPGGGNYTVAPSKQGSVDFVPRNQVFASLSANQRADFKRPPPPQLLANVSAASYDSARFAPNSIVTAFGSRLATETQAAASDPLPVYLVGTTALLHDSRGDDYFAPLFFVSPTQVNYLIPEEVAPGLATITITGGDGIASSVGLMIEATAPGLFTADASGRGLLAGVALRIKANGAQSYEPVARFDTTQNKLVPIPIDLGPAGDQVYLLCFGTGIRNRSAMSAVNAQLGGLSAQIAFVGPQGGFFGLDQANLLLSRALIGRGEVELALSVDGKAANPVKVWIK